MEKGGGSEGGEVSGEEGERGLQGMESVAGVGGERGTEGDGHVASQVLSEMWDFYSYEGHLPAVVGNAVRKFHGDFPLSTTIGSSLSKGIARVIFFFGYI